MIFVLSEQAEQQGLSGLPGQRGTVPGGAHVGTRLLRLSPVILALCALALLLVALRDEPSAFPGGKNLGTLPGTVAAVAFSPDGRWLASGGWGCPVVIWDLALGRKRLELPDGPPSTFRLAFSPDGSCLAAAGLNRSLRLWKTADWSPLRVLQDHTGVVRSLAFSPDGELLATAGADGVLLLWRTSDWRQLGRVEDRPGSLSFATFTPDGASILTAGRDGKLTLWDRGLVRVATIRQGSRAEGRVFRFAFCPVSNQLAVVLHSSTVGLWDLEGRGDGPLFGEPGFFKGIDDLALSPDGRLLATGRITGDVELWDVTTRQRVSGRRRHPSSVTALAFSPDGRTLASGAEDGSLKLWELTSGPIPR